ncbi:hypothetical protein [Planotetraspora silvatica]|uniref:hypothetical protein n=1 Tax=Planotetraspora silvatica TaxID=234614 RepID=UPI00194F16C7|nr:hypothetical protein [Planotetraspora silvatica]
MPEQITHGVEVLDDHEAVASVAKSDPPISGQMRRYRTAFGRTGTRLLRQAEAGDADACVRLAVVTLLHGWQGEAREWLRRARVEGHRDARALQPDARKLAADLAFQYGCEYEDSETDKTSIAMLFHQLAAGEGHAEAAFQLGKIYAQKGDQWSAATWFSRAANHDHTHAAAKFNAISKQLSSAPWSDDGVPIDLI